MMTRPIWTSHAIAAFLAGDEPCHACGGHGRIRVTSARDLRTCPMCRGSGVPITIRNAFDLGFSRDEYKVTRQITSNHA